MYRNKLIQAVKKVYPRFGLKNDDIILASYPKSGNTWVRFIWLNIVSIEELDGTEINFHSVNGPLNAEYDSHSYGKINYNTLPRLVKTHSPYDDRFSKNKSIYLVRHPGDVMVSYHKYLLAAKNSKKIGNDISEFLLSPRFGIEAWCKHVHSWIKNANLVLKYESLKKNSFKEIRSLLKKFDLYKSLNETIVKESVQKSSFDQMQKLEVEKGRPNMEKNFKQNYKFTRKGKVGEWEKEFSNDDILLMRSMLEKYSLNSLYNI